jgi:hypothetical protein
MASFTPCQFSTGTTAQRLQWVRETMGRILAGGQESETMGNRNQRVSYAQLLKAEAELLNQLATETNIDTYNVAEVWMPEIGRY